VRISGTTLAAGLLVGSLALLTASGPAVATDRAGGRDYHTLTKVKKTKVQACLGPVRETAVGPGVPLYVRLNNKAGRVGSAARVTTNLLDKDYYAAAHRSDAGFYAVLAPDELVRIKYTAYQQTVEFEIVAASIGAC
jgi:hypothetical protein